ncbi:LacI family DNA-binding transcriptional regulator [Aureimonas sp. AU12]|uniref:LacI family DNA-binding transcriptional regulator n=1 Tax=Aureimonas sp. AU12 TaxID=1638161 RepID=UPI000B28498C|nr:LacI family DNA-binding transcriptional regulator [Aureimonas sp. AU12]
MTPPQPTRGRDGAPRIVDVARHAGVSTATVSRALATPGQVRPELRERVAAAVRALGYTPNAAARQLRGGRSRMILVVTLKRWSAPFFSEVLRGIDHELSLDGYSMILGNLDLDRDRERHVVDMMFSGHIDGAIALSGIVARSEGRTMLDAGLPVVSICSATAGTMAVLTDEGESIVAAARHLAGEGHRDFAYLSGPAGNYNDAVRAEALAAFFAGPEASGLRLRRIEGDFTTQSGAQAGAHFLTLDPRPTAVLCCSDEMAIGFMKVVQAGGLEVPRDVSVFGFDGIEFADYCEPTLTTVRQPRFDLGRTGARRLLDRLAGTAPSGDAHLILRNELSIRNSTGPAPGVGRARRTA